MKKMKHSIRVLLAGVFVLAGCIRKPAEPAVQPTAAPVSTQAAIQTPASAIPEDTECDDKACVAEYLSVYWHLPNNFMTKKEARKYGWESGPLWRIVEGKAIGGDEFLNMEGYLPYQYTYAECDIDSIGLNTSHRNRKRIVYSADGKLIYYTDDHYNTFELLYGEE